MLKFGILPQKWTILFATLADENRVSSKYIPRDVSNQRAEKALSVSFQNHAFFYTVPEFAGEIGKGLLVTLGGVTNFC